MNLKIFVILTLTLATSALHAQFGYGFTLSNDLYHRYVNPKSDAGNFSRSSGSAILNLGAGPKLWAGGKNVSLSVEAQAVLGILALSSGEYKGMGTMAFPVIAKLNFKGLSTMDREGKMGFSIGGGLQWTKTEFYGVTDEYAAKGLKRNYFKTFIVQAGYGFGLSGFTLHGFARYGFNRTEKSNVLSIGLQYDFNAPMLKKISNPESAL